MINSDLLSAGIDVQNSLAEAPNRDYEFLYLPYGKAGGVLGRTLEADIERDTLPKRIVVGGVGENETEGDRFYATIKETLDIPSDEGDVLPVYDEWISFLLKRRGLQEVYLSFFFEQLIKGAENWKKFSQVPEYIYQLDSFAGEGSRATDRLESSRHTNGIFLWRHTSLSKLFEKSDPKRENIIYFQECTFADSFFTYLSSVDPEDQLFQAKYLMRQIVEAALCRIIIVDERIAKTVASQGVAQELAWMGIWVVGSIRFQNGGTPVLVQNGEDEEGNEIVVGVKPSQKNGLVTLVVNKRGNGFSTSIRKPDGTENFPDVPEEIEILTIHQTLLDGRLSQPIKKVTSNIGKWKELWIHGMKPEVLFAYSHSGRGHPRELLPENTSFLEYSVLQTHIINQMSKFFFVQLALSNKSQKK